MANILQTDGKQKFIASAKKLSEKDGVLEYEIKVNGALQKEIYEALYKEKAKNVEVKGFRKGKAPRELVEPQIYAELVENLQELVVNYAVGELLEEYVEGVVLGKPQLLDIQFSVVESPIVFKIKLFVVKELKLPDIEKFKSEVKEPKITVDDKEVDEAIKQIFEEWVKKAPKDKKEKFTKPTDEWVKELNVPNITNLEELRARIKADIEHSKLHEYTNQTLQKVLDKILGELNIKLPKEYLESAVESRIKQDEEGIKKYGITLEKYLEYYKKTKEDYRKEIEADVLKKTKEELFWAFYIRKYDIKIDLKDKKDQVYLNYAVAALRLPQDMQLTQAVLGEIIRVARMYKAVEDLQERLGLHVHNHEHAHDGDSERDTSAEQEDESKAKGVKKEEADKQGEAKILIPGKDD